MSDDVADRRTSPEAVLPTRRRRAALSGRQLRLAALGLLAVAGLAGYGRHWWTTGRFIETTDDAYVGGNVTPLAPHVSGFVEQILVRDNQRVQAGQVLLRLDARDFQAALDHDRAVLAARQAALQGLTARVLLQQATIRQQEADLAAQTAHATFAAADAARYRNLAQTSAGSRQDAQRADALDQEARSAVAAAAAGLDAARQQLQVLRAQIAEAAASVAQAGADVQTADLNLGYTEIRSPIDGVVGNRAAEVGGYVTPGTYLISVIPARGLWVDANFKEDQLTRMQPGEPASVIADVLPGHEFHGHVVSLAPGTGAIFSVIPPENATGNFTKIVQRVPVRIALDADAAGLEMLRPGLSITASVDTRGDTASVP